MRTLKDKLPSGTWRIRAQRPDGKWPTIALCSTEEEADEVRAEADGILVEKAPPREATTFGDWVRVWMPTRNQGDQRRLRRHVLDDPIASIPLRTLNSGHIRGWRKRMEKKRAMVRGPRREWIESDRPLSSKSIREVLVMVRVALAAAVEDGRLSKSPAGEVKLPPAARTKALSYLYPDEDARLVTSARVPFAYRLIYGFLAREGMRVSEALRLQWCDLDLERGIVMLDENKSDDPRAWAMSPDVLVTMRAVREERSLASARDSVFLGAQGRPLRTLRCERFRSHLRKAGVKRLELYASTPKRSPIRIHDLRSTFVTLSLAAGRNERWVQDRTGHTTNAMLQRYHRAARTAVEVGLGGPMRLDELLGLAAAGSTLRSTAQSSERKAREVEMMQLSGTRDSKRRLGRGKRSEVTALFGGRGSAVDLAIALDRAMRGDSDEEVERLCLAIADARAASLRDDLDLIERVRAEGPDMVAAAVELLASWLGERAGERKASGGAS